MKCSASRFARCATSATRVLTSLSARITAKTSVRGVVTREISSAATSARVPSAQLTWQRIAAQRLVLTRPPKPTPFAFPIMADRLREKITSESVEDRLKRLALEYQ